MGGEGGQNHLSHYTASFGIGILQCCCDSKGSCCFRCLAALARSSGHSQVDCRHSIQSVYAFPLDVVKAARHLQQQVLLNCSRITDSCPAHTQPTMCSKKPQQTHCLLFCVQALQAGVPAVLAAPSLLATAASAPGPGLWLIPTGQHASGCRKLKRPPTSCKDAPQVTKKPPAPPPAPRHHPLPPSWTLIPSVLASPPPHPPIKTPLITPYARNCCLGAIVQVLPMTLTVLHFVGNTAWECWLQYLLLLCFTAWVKWSASMQRHSCTGCFPW